MIKLQIPSSPTPKAFGARLQRSANSDESRAGLQRNWWGVLSAVAVGLSAAAFGAEGVPTAPAPGKTEETNSLEMLRLQEQLHATRLAVERYRQETEEATARNSEAVAGRLKNIEQALEAQRGREWETIQSSNRAMLSSNRAIVTVGGTVAGIGFVAVLLMAYFQWRMVNRLAEISAVLPTPRLALGQGNPAAALGTPDTHLVTVGPVEQSNLRLFDAVERLEKRIHELEHTTHPPLNDAPLTRNETPPTPAPSNSAPTSEAPTEEAAPTTEAGRITVLLGKGQSLLNLDKAEESLACFDEVLTLEGDNAEALVKKGTALERLRKLDEAIECYDRAIAADGSMTIAYLCKGGLFNRLERFTEALECYEQALRTQEKRRG